MSEDITDTPLKTNVDSSELIDAAETKERNEVPDNVFVSQDEWAALDDSSRQFLYEAATACMSHLAENGEVCAWGEVCASFSMPIERRPDAEDGYFVTLANT